MDLASCSNRALWRPLSCFTATMRPKRVSRAFQTSPMPPAPRGATISYGPSLSPTESGIGVIYQVYLVGGAWFPYHGLTGSYPVALVERDEIVETLTTDSRMKPNRSRPIP